MRAIIKIIFITIAVLVLLVTAAYLFVIFKGKTIIVQKLEELTQKEVTIDYLALKPPYNLEIRNIEIRDLLKARSIYISPSILGFLSGNIAFNEVKLAKAELTHIYEKAPGKTTKSITNSSFNNIVTAVKPITQPITQPTTQSEAQPKTQVKSRYPRGIILKHVNIKESSLNFIDRSVGGDGIKITIQDIYFNLDNLFIIPRSVATNFEFKGKIPWKEESEQGSIEAEGWLDLYKKNMQATLEIKNIDGIYLYPYYSNWVDLERARIQEAKLNFTSFIQGLNNNVTADCHLELTDIVFRPRESDEEMDKAEKIAAAVLDIFKALNKGKIELDFTIKTKMDRPQFGFGDIKMAFEDKLVQAGRGNGLKVDNILALPGKLLGGAIKEVTDLSKAVINGTFAVGKELKKAVEDSFRK